MNLERLTTGLTQRDLELIRLAAESQPAIERLVLFGSRAKGKHRQGSDVDLVVEGNAVTNATVSAVADRLNEELPLPYFFDVLNDNTLSDDALREHIGRVGITIYEKADLLQQSSAS